MSAVMMPLKSGQQFARVTPAASVVSTYVEKGTENGIVITGASATIASEAEAPLILNSSEFPPVPALTSYRADEVSSDVQMFHELRLFAGVALIAAVVVGLAFGWSPHKELAQWLGAAAAVLIYAANRWLTR